MITLTDDNFEKEILNAQKPILVDFYAFWCPPCILLSPILEKIDGEFKEKIIYARVDLDLSPITAKNFGIEKIPTIILFKKGKPVSGFFGLRSEAEIRKWLQKNLEDYNPPTALPSEAWAPEAEKIERIIQEYQEYAQKNGFSLNPNRKIVEGIIKSLLEREKKFGKRYCPCRQITGNEEEDRKKICPCFWHRQEIEKTGHCLCGLFGK